MSTPLTTQRIIEDVRRVGREHGYAVGVHGSQKRDLDLIACPWVDKAHAASTLVRAVGALPYLKRRPDDGDYQFPVACPHGRLGWVFFILRGGRRTPWYLDLSVIPRLVPSRQR